MNRAVASLSLLLAMTTPAYAGGSSGALDTVLTVVFGALAPIAGALGLSAARWIRAKTRIDLSREIDAGLDYVLGLAEQRARQRLKAGGDKMPSAEKLGVAMAELTKLATRKKWPTWVKDRAEDLIEARLGQHGLRMR